MNHLGTGGPPGHQGNGSPDTCLWIEGSFQPSWNGWSAGAQRQRVPRSSVTPVCDGCSCGAKVSNAEVQDKLPSFLNTAHSLRLPMVDVLDSTKGDNSCASGRRYRDQELLFNTKNSACWSIYSIKNEFITYLIQLNNKTETETLKSNNQNNHKTELKPIP